MSTAPEAASPSKRALGFWMCLALVIGNMIGSGVYLLPASLAPLGWNGVFGWLVTIAGALCLAYVFAALSRFFPKAGGPYAFCREAFGPFTGFVVAWSYWISLWVGNTAIATGVVAPLSTIFPGITAYSVLITGSLVWLLTAVNCIGVRTAGQVQLATTILKFVPLAAVVALAALVVSSGGAASAPPFDPDAITFSGITAAGALTLWAFLGLESATIPADKVENPSRTIGRATMIGTAVTGAIYLFACSSVALLLPAEGAAKSGAPLADFVALHWGADAGTALAVFAAISAFGALNGWILLQGEMPWAMARDGTFPGWLGKSSSRGTPVRAHIVSSLLLTLVLMTNYARSMAELFTFLILLATTASLVLYLACSLAALRLQSTGRIPQVTALPLIALLGAVYALWTIWGAGAEAVGWGAALLATGVPVYWLMQRSSRTAAAAPAAPPG
jgi:basic amino acid/polyamine antiporter, APA family